MHVSLFRHGSARVLIRCSNVRPHAVVYAFNCVHADNMRLSSWTSKLLARSAVRLHAERMSLMNNYLQQCKTNPHITMRRWAMFQHDSPQFLLCSTVILVTQSCLWINNNATFLSTLSGMLSCSPQTVVFYSPGEHFSREDNCIHSVCVPSTRCIPGPINYILTCTSK